MADIEQRLDGTILFPTIDSGAIRSIGTYYQSLSIDCSSLGLTPSVNHTAKLARRLVPNSSGGYNSATVGSDWSETVASNVQGDFSATITADIPLGGSFPSAADASFRMPTFLIDAQPYNFQAQVGSDQDYYRGQSGVSSTALSPTIIDGDTGEYVVPVNFICIYQFDLTEDGVGVVKTVDVPVAYKLLFMCDRTYITSSTIQVIQYITCDFDTPLNDTQSASYIGTSVEKAIIPYNKTTEREVVHLDYRIKSTD